MESEFSPSVYLVVTLIIIGNLVNPTAGLIYLRKRLRRFSHVVYLTTLCFTDWLQMFIEFIYLFTYHLNLISWPNENGWCQLTAYLTRWAVTMSAYTIVMFTMERFVVVCWPLKRIHFDIKRAKLVVGVMALCIGILWSPILFMLHGPDPDDQTNNVTDVNNGCTIPDHYIAVFGALITYVDFVISFAIPAFLIVFFNFVIGYKMIVAHRFRRTFDEDRKQSVPHKTSHCRYRSEQLPKCSFQENEKGEKLCRNRLLSASFHAGTTDKIKNSTSAHCEIKIEQLYVPASTGSSCQSHLVTKMNHSNTTMDQQRSTGQTRSFLISSLIFTLSCTYIILNCPFYIALLSPDSTKYPSAAYVLYLSQFTLHVFIYTILHRQFRREAALLLPRFSFHKSSKAAPIERL